MTGIVAVVPLKRLTEAKSRLGASLSDEERRSLARGLAERTVDVLRQAGLVRIGLATPEAELAADLQVDHLSERSSLNATLAQAAPWALGLRADGLLIMPADLPLLGVEDAVKVLSAAPREREMTIAATHDGGTAALLLRPPELIEPSFGKFSFESHVRRAQELGVPVSIVESPGLRFDLDTAEDLNRFGLGDYLPVT
jgi:2-phospho-L-lactate/phosphoenolpyruvate guanylyltransferase